MRLEEGPRTVDVNLIEVGYDCVCVRLQELLDICQHIRGRELKVQGEVCSW
jgi:hypothetical protein